MGSEVKSGLGSLELVGGFGVDWEFWSGLGVWSRLGG